MKHLYGKFSTEQIAQTVQSLRGAIFHLLLYVDFHTSWEYEDVDVNKSFHSILLRMGGLNRLLGERVELVTSMSLLQAAQMEFNNPKFKFKTYRKLILDAGAELEKLAEEE